MYMPIHATYEDVNLILKLYEMRREDKMRAARDYFGSTFSCKNMQEFQQHCPPGSERNAYFRQVVTYWDMVAGFITAGVLNEELFFESGRELLLVWERVRDFLPHYRAATKDPMAWHNLEAVGTRYVEYMKRRGPEAYEAFSERIAGMVKK